MKKRALITLADCLISEVVFILVCRIILSTHEGLIWTIERSDQTFGAKLGCCVVLLGLCALSAYSMNRALKRAMELAGTGVIAHGVRRMFAGVLVGLQTLLPLMNLVDLTMSNAPYVDYDAGASIVYEQHYEEEGRLLYSTYSSYDGASTLQFVKQVDKGKIYYFVLVDDTLTDWTLRFMPQHFEVVPIRLVTMPDGQVFGGSAGVMTATSDGDIVTITRDDPIEYIMVTLPFEHYVRHDELGVVVWMALIPSLSILGFGLLCSLTILFCGGIALIMTGIITILIASIRKWRAYRAARSLG